MRPTALEFTSKRLLGGKRNSIIKLTPAAVSRLSELMKDSGEYLKVGTKKKGCSGNAYTLDYVKDIHKLDEVVRQDGVTVVVDSKALFSLIGSEMDFVKDELSSQFVFKYHTQSQTLTSAETLM